MAGERTLKVTILGDADKLRSALGDAESHLSNFGSKAAVALGVGTAALGAFGLSAINAASDVQETMSKISVIFGSAADAAGVYAEDLAAAHTAAGKAQEKYQDAVEKAEAKIADIRDRGREKAEEAAQKITDAENDLSDVTEDASERVKEAKESAADVAENVADRIKEAEESAAERVEGAQERQAEAHDRAAEKREAAAERVIEAETALAKAQTEGAKPEVIERLTERVNDARENQAKVTDRTAKDMAKADKEAAKASEDAAESVEKAKKNGAKAVEDANERVAKAEETARKAVEDAEERVAKARAEAAKVHEETAKAEDKVRASLGTSRKAANEAQAEVARIETEIAKARAEATHTSTEANKQWVKEIETFAESATKNYGLSKREALDASATFAVFGKAAGLTGEDLVKFSTKLTGLSGDLTSFHNPAGGSTQAIEALGAALRGESEPMRQFGVNLNDATLKAKAMEMGIYDGTGALTSQQKTLAAYQIILDKTNDAQGDYIRTGDSFANRQRTLTKEFDNLKVAIGERLLPVANAVLGWVTDLSAAFQKDGLGGALTFVREEFSKLLDKLGPVGDGLRRIGEVFEPVVNWFRDFAKDNPEAMFAALGAVIATLVVPPFVAWAAATIAATAPIIAITAAVAALTAGVVWAYQNVDWFRESVDAVASFMKNTLWPILQDVGKWFGETFVNAAGFAKDAWDKVLYPALRALWTFTSETLWPILETVGEFFAKVLVGAWDAVSTAWDKVLSPILHGLHDFIKDPLLPILGTVAEWFSKVLVGAWDAVSTAWDKVLSPILHGLHDFIKDPLLPILGTVAEWFSKGIGVALDVAKGAFDVAKTAIELALKPITLAIDGIKTGLDLLPAAVQAIEAPFKAVFAAVELAIGPLIKSIQWIIEHLPSLGGGGAIGGGGETGVSRSGKRIEKRNGQWVYSDFGTPVPESDLPSGAQPAGGGGGSTGGAPPTTSQGATGQTLAQMAASGMTPAQIAQQTGLPIDDINATLAQSIASGIGGWFGSPPPGGADDPGGGAPHVPGAAGSGSGGSIPYGTSNSRIASTAASMTNTFQSQFEADCADFVSAVLRNNGYTFPMSASAGQLVRNIGALKQHVELSPSQAIPGDIIYWHGKQYGAIKDAQGFGYHVALVGPNHSIYEGANGEARFRQSRGDFNSGHILRLGDPPGLAMGGIVRARPGGTLALLAEAGQDEAVIPLPRGGGVATAPVIQVHLHGDVYGERDFLMRLRDGFIDLERQGVTMPWN